MPKYFLIFLTLTLCSLALILPQLALAAPEGLVPCETAANPAPCDYSQFLNLIARIFKYLLYIVVPLAVISIAYAGALYVIYPTNQGKRGEAHGIITAAVIGLAIALAGYLIVTTIVKQLTGDQLNNVLEKVNL